MANDSEQVEDGRPVAIKSSATTNGNGSQEPSPTLQVPSIIPSIKVIKVVFTCSQPTVCLHFRPPSGHLF
ncbi:hypothetical protein OUZ56_030112 [Daphnia magna]|uniref:Uncharacterized protein n=1 Tax=Daphnia magna TaxID=35525 RepID=A0ABQ9ZQB8_9CRUS|nr:hypothetical protein OUZ56_030112 [Daphnia magna]